MGDEGKTEEASETIGIQNVIMDIKDALKNVQYTLKGDEICKDGHEAVENDKEAMKCMQLLVLEMILQGMIENTKETVTAEIVFVNKINNTDISWTVGLAEKMKKQNEDEQANIVVFDIGSSSTKIWEMSKNKNEDWSEMKNIKTLSGG